MDPAVAPTETGASAAAPGGGEEIKVPPPPANPSRAAEERSVEPAKGRRVGKKDRGKVLPDTLTLQPIPRRPGSASGRKLLRSAILVIGLPTLAAAVYFGLFASNQYAATGSFIVKTSTGHTINPATTMVIGAPPTSEISETLAVNEYILSPQIIADLQPRLDLRAMYGNPDIDWYARLKPAWGEDTITNEQLLLYWKHMVGVYFDVTTGITTLEVKAFSAAAAQKVASEILTLSEELVNRISERAKEASLSFARLEVESFRQKAMEALDEMQIFQEKAKQVDPQAFAESRNQIQAGLEAETSKLRAQLELLRKSLPEEAPAVAQVTRRLAVMERQLADEKAESTFSVTGESAAAVLNEFNKIKLENQFAQAAYLDSLSSLERARAEAQKQGLFLESFITPQLPQTAEYPQRLLSVFLVFIGSAIVWGVGGLFIATAREHL